MSLLKNYKFCGCGYPIIVDEVFNGLGYVTRFYDGNTDQEIDCCPGCGESVISWLEVRGEVLRLKRGALLDEMPDDFKEMDD